ncbi:Signal peptidase complex subunit 2 [Mortierella antarctica]|nr:Signal peptidase complex subunit 2 [Mortierella antarctica]
MVRSSRPLAGCSRVIKVDKSSLPDLKNACDEAVKEYLETKAGYRQSHRHTDIKLALGYVGCAFAAAGSYYGYIHPFELPATKFWTLVTVVLYYLFNVLMMAYAYLVEKNTIFSGSKITPTGTQVISVGSSIKNYDPYYELEIQMDFTGSSTTSSSGSSKTTKARKATHQHFSTAFRFWFDEDGVLAQDLFEADLTKFLANTEATHVE